MVLSDAKMETDKMDLHVGDWVRVIDQFFLQEGEFKNLTWTMRRDPVRIQILKGDCAAVLPQPPYAQKLYSPVAVASLELVWRPSMWIGQRVRLIEDLAAKFQKFPSHGYICYSSVLKMGQIGLISDTTPHGYTFQPDGQKSSFFFPETSLEAVEPVVTTNLEELGEINPEALTMDGFDEAILGTAQQWGSPSLAVYDREKCIEVLHSRDGMDYEEAEEYFSFNCECAYVGPGTPLILTKFQE